MRSDAIVDLLDLHSDFLAKCRAARSSELMQLSYSLAEWLCFKTKNRSLKQA